MSWPDTYDVNTQPTKQEIESFIASPLWEDLNNHLQTAYGIEPSYSYSQCAGQPGWNVKYKKSGKSLCTLYPMPGFFIALVVIGTKERHETELALPTMTEYIQKLYSSTPFSAGGQWLMINVTDPTILTDVKQLVKIRLKPKNIPACGS